MKACYAILNKKPGMDDIRTFALRYAEHPFLPMYPNPEFKNSLGEKIHNKYGFRDKRDFSDFDRERDIIVYCAGSSSVYCNYIERNEDTWPAVLETRLNEAGKDVNVKVVNGACGGWTCLHSLVRFSAWVDVLKPNLVIIYHGKSEFTPFFIGDTSKPEVFPDYSNIMHHLKLESLFKKMPFLVEHTYTGKVIYGMHINYAYGDVLRRIYNKSKFSTRKETGEGLKRIGPREWDFIISRYKSFISLCKDRGISVLFVTELVLSDVHKYYMDELNRRIMSLESKGDNCFVYDFAEDVKGREGILYDTVHFSENGAKICAERISDYVTKNIPLFRRERTS